MSNEARKKREPWRIVLCVLSLLFILYMWLKKDLLSIYTSMPLQEALPLLVTTVAVSLVKVAVLTGGILLVKWIIGKVMGHRTGSEG